MEDQPITPIQIRTFFYILRKHQWKILTLFVSSVVIAVVYSLLRTPIYQASSQLLVKPGREDIYVSPTGSSPTVVDSSYRGEKVTAEMEILRGLGLVTLLVDRVGISWLFDYPDRTLKGRLFKKNTQRKIPPKEQVYKSVFNRLGVSNVRRSNVINIKFEWPDPFIAAKMVNTLVELYLDQHLKVHTNPRTYDLLEQQAKKWEIELRTSEKQLEAFKRRHSITSLPEQRTLLLGMLSEAESQMKLTENQILENQELVATLKTQLSNLDQNVQLQETVNRDSETIAALKSKLADLELQGLKEEIRRIKEMIAEEEKKEQVVVTSGKSPLRQTIESDLMTANASLEALRAKLKSQQLQIVSQKEELRILDGFEKRLKELERQVEIDEANYKLYVTTPNSRKLRYQRAWINRRSPMSGSLSLRCLLCNPSNRKRG